jgi:hypothetical protein
MRVWIVVIALLIAFLFGIADLMPGAPKEAQTGDFCATVRGGPGHTCPHAIRIKCDQRRVSVASGDPEFPTVGLVFDASIPRDARLMNALGWSSKVRLSLTGETPSQFLARWRHGIPTLFKHPKQQWVGTALIVSETDTRPTGQYFVVAPKAADQWFAVCTKPFLTSRGDIQSKTGCMVKSLYEPNLVVEYTIRLEHLSEWEEIDATVRRELSKITQVTRLVQAPS